MLYADVPAQIIDGYGRKDQDARIQDTVGCKSAVLIGQHKYYQKQYQRQQRQNQTGYVSRERDQDTEHQGMYQHSEREESYDCDQLGGFILLSGVPADIFINSRED